MGRIRVKFLVGAIILIALAYFTVGFFVRRYCAELDRKTQLREKARTEQIAKEWPKILAVAKSRGLVWHGSLRSDSSLYDGRLWERFIFLDTTAALKPICGFPRGAKIANNNLRLIVVGFDPTKPDSILVKDDYRGAKENFLPKNFLQAEGLRTMAEAGFIASNFRKRVINRHPRFGGWPLDDNPFSPLTCHYPEITGYISPGDTVNVWYRVDSKKWKFVSKGVVVGYCPYFYSDLRYITEFFILTYVFKSKELEITRPRNLPPESLFPANLYISSLYH
ncbi:MAG: hypothetical protein PHT40_00560 [Patescibacteria group bacterium]|nr:hypothetical protein [Patescibacteria group bacterium]